MQFALPTASLSQQWIIKIDVRFQVWERSIPTELTGAGNIMAFWDAVQVQELNMWEQSSEPVTQDPCNHLATQPHLSAT
jgi:hypothetical protein